MPLLEQAMGHLAAGRLHEARVLYEQLLRDSPGHPTAHHHLGVIAHGQNDLPGALAHLQQAACLAPDNGEILTHLGVVLKQAGRFREAQEAYEKALVLAPHDAVIHFNLGALKRADNRVAEAMHHFRQAIALQPCYPDAHNNLGLLRQQQGEEAESHFLESLRHDPTFAEAHNNLGILHAESGRHQEAALCFSRALHNNPRFPRALFNLGNALAELGRPREALGCLDQVLQLAPDLPGARLQRLHLRQKVCQWEGMTQEIEALSQQADTPEQRRGMVPFRLLSLPGFSAQALKEYAILFSREAFPAVPVDPPRPAPPGPRLHIGYLSADFHDHATAWLIIEAMEHHDRERFTTFAYSHGPDDGGSMRRRLAQAFSHFIDVSALTPHQCAERMRQDGLHILVDLKGHTRGSRLSICALRPAPVQVHWLGYPGTLGAPFIDYFLGDAVASPLAHEFTEKLALMPYSYQPNDSQRAVGTPTTRAEQGLPETGFLFACFNHTFKITPGRFDTWCHLLREVPGSWLWLLAGHDMARDNLRREALRRGVEEERILFAPHVPLARHLARLSLADLFLDSEPYNAHTTASDALWAGVPVVTRRGVHFASRVAASLLTAAGLPELITESEAAYGELALKLARDKEAWAALREKTARAAGNSPLFDGAAFAAHLEGLYERMWARHQAGLPPDHLLPGGSLATGHSNKETTKDSR